jgi:hypothetical protein
MHNMTMADFALTVLGSVTLISFIFVYFFLDKRTKPHTKTKH